MIVYFLFVIGFVILIIGANWLVDGSASLAKRFNISNLVIGLTVVAFGTSSPELAVNIFASEAGSTDIAIGNILGSNIFNILLILGVSAVIYPLTVHRNTTWKEIPFSLLAAVVLALAANDAFLDGTSFSILSRSDGLILLSFFIIFIYYTYNTAKTSTEEGLVEIKMFPEWKSLLMVLAGLVMLIFGGKWIVDGAVKMATVFGMTEAVIGLTIVAAGTSLPELATSAVAAYKKNTDIAIGNVVGSNIFNIFLVLGISAVYSPLPFSPENNIDIGMVILSSILLFALIFVGKRHQLTRSEGIAFLILFVGYMSYLIIVRA